MLAREWRRIVTTLSCHAAKDHLRSGVRRLSLRHVHATVWRSGWLPGRRNAAIHGIATRAPGQMRHSYSLRGAWSGASVPLLVRAELAAPDTPAAQRTQTLCYYGFICLWRCVVSPIVRGGVGVGEGRSRSRVNKRHVVGR